MKIKKSLIAGIFLIFLMVGSSFAYGVIQSFAPQEDNGEIELPTQSIIDYKLTPAQQRQLTLRGVTVVEVEYSLMCQACASTRAQLESAVQQFSGQIMLSELAVSDSSSLPLVRMESSYGSRVFSKPTSDQIMSAFCDLLTSPPASCAVRTR